MSVVMIVVYTPKTGMVLVKKLRDLVVDLHGVKSS